MLPFHQIPGSSSLAGLLLARGGTIATAIKVNLAASADPGVGDDSGDGYGVGSVWVNTNNNKVFIAANVSVGAAVWREVAASAGIKETITAANSFAVGDVIRRTGSGYTKSQSDSAGNSEVLGVVEAASGSEFTIVYDGKINLPAHGFTNADVLFLSDATAGLLTATEPTTTGSISKPIATVLDADNVIIQTMRGMVLAPATTGYAAPALSSATFTRGTDKVFQRVTGTLGAAVIYNLSRTNAVQGDWFEFGIVDVVTSGSNTLTFRENGSGTLVAFSDIATLNGSIKFVYSGSAWVIFSQHVQGT